MTVMITRIFIGKFRYEIGSLWARADDAHVTAQYIEKLGKLVDRSRSDESAYRTHPIIVCHAPELLRFLLTRGLQ